MAKFRTIAPLPPTRPPKPPVPFIPGGFYTENGAVYFIMDADEAAVLHQIYCLAALHNGKKVSVWMTAEEMTRFLNKKNRYFVHRPDAEVVIRLEPGEDNI